MGEEAQPVCAGAEVGGLGAEAATRWRKQQAPRRMVFERKIEIFREKSMKYFKFLG